MSCDGVLTANKDERICGDICKVVQAAWKATERRPKDESNRLNLPANFVLLLKYYRIVIINFQVVLKGGMRPDMMKSVLLFCVTALVWATSCMLQFLDLEGTCWLQDRVLFIADLLLVACILVLLKKLILPRKSRPSA